MLRFTEALVTKAGGLITMIGDLPFNLLYLTEYFSPSGFVAPYWFLSAMFIGFPFFCLLINIDNKYLLGLISITLPLFYYGITGFSMPREIPHDIVRIFSDMLLGTFVFGVNRYLKEYKFNKSFLTSIELLCFSVVVLNTITDRIPTNFMMVVFVIFISIMLSGKSATNNINIPFSSFLGRISFPIYACHWTVGTVLWQIYSRGLIAQSKAYVIYYIGTFIVSITLYCFISSNDVSNKIFKLIWYK